MIGRVSLILKRLLPTFLYSVLLFVYIWFKKVLKLIHNVYFKIKLKKVQANHKKALELARKKERTKVVFFLIHESVWKYEGVYKLMEQNERFEPLVVVCPYVVYGEEIMLNEMNQAYQGFKRKGYNVIKTIGDNGKWLDVKKELRPDIVFFSNPWKLTKEAYSISAYLDSLTCYVPYFYQVTKHLDENFGGYLQNNVWKAFYESEIHLNYAKEFSKNFAKNVVVSGYPGLDSILFPKVSDIDPWKIKDRKTKRIIWAPHHTIEGQDSGLGLSNFLQYAEFFQHLILSKDYEIQIAFKPHPLLKSKLYINSNWGIRKTEEYFNFWEKNERGMLIEGEYVNLFLTSDAMIHDSGSFTVEFLATKRPTLYLIKSSVQLNSLNSFGLRAVDCHYKASNSSEIEIFIKEVVIYGDDYMKNERISFIARHLLPPNNKTASQNIYDHIVSLIN